MNVRQFLILKVAKIAMILLRKL